MNKDKVKEMICKAIDNMPDCAEIIDCYTEHSLFDSNARIIVKVNVKDNSVENIEEFNDIAHNAFDTDMGFIG